jgi:hypothetical protein
MGFIANLLKRKSVPQDKVDSSLKMLDMLKEKRGAAIGKYLDLQIDPRQIPAPGPPPTIEDLDEQTPDDSSIYSPSMPTDDLTETGDPIETGINRFFDIFAGLASAHNQTVKSEDLKIGIQRPWHSGETFPETTGKPLLNAALHTRDWGIFFFGHDNNIDTYLLPYDKESSPIYKDVRESADCHPLLAVTTRDGSNGREWYVGGKRLFPERLPDLAKELIGDLVDAAQMHHSDS